MSRTQTRYDCDLGYADGVIDLSAFDFVAFGGTAPTATRGAKGDYSWAQGSSLTNEYACLLSKMLFRTGLQDYTMNRFGAGGSYDNPYGADAGIAFGTPTTQSTASATAAGLGVAVNIAVKYSGLFIVGRGVLIGGTNPEYQRITAIPDATHITVAQLLHNHTSVFSITQGVFTTPAGQSGPSVANSSAGQFTPPTSRPKGILIRGMEVRYEVGTADLTSITIGLSQTLFENATALAITDILAPAQNGLVLTHATTPYVVPIALASPVYLTNDLFEYSLEIIPVTPSTSTFNLYGVTLYVTYNFN